MRRADPIPTCMAVLAALAWTAAPAWAQSGQELFNRSFQVAAGTHLQVDVGDADVRLEPGPTSTLEVSVLVEATSSEAGRAFWERMEFRASSAGNRIRIRARDPEMGSSWWRSDRRARAVVVIRHPPRMSMRVASGDGDIEARDLVGEIELYSGDGDIRVASLRGGPARIETSDGDIRLGGAEVGLLDVDTSDGEVELGPVRAELRVSSGDGDIRVELAGALPTFVETGDGDVILLVPPDLAATLDLEGEEISMDRAILVEGRIREGRLRGEVGGGGPEIRVTTGDGEIRVRRR